MYVTSRGEMGGRARSGLGEGSTGTGVKAASGAATGAAVGTAIFPGIGTAVGAVIGGLVGLIGAAKVHQSPWGFMYDEYPRKIYDAEALMRRATGEAIPPDPDPGQAMPRGGAAYQTAMLNIVPRYVPGSESQIAAYDRRLNEAGGAYELTVQRQLEKSAAMQGQIAPNMPPQMATAAKPASSNYSVATGSAVIPSSVPITPAVQLTPAQRAAAMQYSQAGMFPSSLGPYAPLVMIGVAAAVILSAQPSKKKRR